MEPRGRRVVGDLAGRGLVACGRRLCRRRLGEASVFYVKTSHSQAAARNGQDIWMDEPRRKYLGKGREERKKIILHEEQ